MSYREPHEQLADHEDQQQADIAELQQAVLTLGNRVTELEEQIPPVVVDPPDGNSPEYSPSVSILAEGGTKPSNATTWKAHDVVFTADELYLEKLESFIWSQDRRTNERYVEGLDQERYFTRDEIQDSPGTIELKVKAYFRTPEDFGLDEAEAMGGEIVDGLLLLRASVWLTVDEWDDTVPTDPPNIGTGKVVKLSQGDDPEKKLQEVPVGGVLEIQNGRSISFNKGFGQAPHGEFSILPAHDGNKPQFLTQGEGLLQVGHWIKVQGILIEHLSAVAARRDPSRVNDLSSYPGNEGGIVVHGYGSGLRINRVDLSHYSFNLVLQCLKENAFLYDVELSYCKILDAWAHWNNQIGGGHSSGVFASYTNGLYMHHNLFDHNGWNEVADGGKATKFNHNIYNQYTCRNSRFEHNVSSRASSHGLQLRSGGPVSNNLFLENPLHFFVGRQASLVENNVCVLSGNIGDDPRGKAIETLPCELADIRNNIISQKVGGDADWMGAINVGYDQPSMDWLEEQGKRYQVRIEDNMIYDWPRSSGPTINIGTDSAGVLVNAGNVEDDSRWVDPSRSPDRYAREVLNADTDFVTTARDSDLYEDEELWAYSTNEWIREGFKVTS